MIDSPGKVSDSFRDAHRNAVLWSAICLAWVGFSVAPDKIKYLDFLVPSRIPTALFLIWIYLSWRLVVELMLDLAAVRSERWRRYDTALTLAVVGSAGVMLLVDFSFRLLRNSERGMPFIENPGYFGVVLASACGAGLLRAFRNTRQNKWLRRLLGMLEFLTVGSCLFVFFAISIVWVLPLKTRGDCEWAAVGTFWMVLALVVYWAPKPALQLVGFLANHPEYHAHR
jgi:hypothetical protein